ncbi:eukaryotic translation initiation factor 2-alpha kinase isoform X1 [Neodiprion virginianus]|uniref:eukaryotic translation initiation factor 2-alpha kinase isoform X1 n=1 Tax=Neodiprion virginianus TaxID=2961670 RepID=UPI001EE74AE3|nr:eukaryotic translation initiation factor 2-alpha kinase isoform X1 [Neodiprion virginianus]
MFGELRIGKSLSFIILLLLTCTTLGNDVQIEQLTFCGQASSDKPSSSLVFVSTLDGKISALDTSQQGKVQWSVQLNDSPMLSSNIHRRELNNNGQWVRLIPSLNGGLYKFDGENVEAVPINSDNLLQTSYRYTDDLVFSGGKETQSYGVSSLTGQVLYECDINGCTNKTDGNAQIDQEVLIIQRFQKTVRAIEPRTGHERWNFSVGQHVLSLVPQEDLDCHDDSPAPLKLDLKFELKVIVPEGRILAVDKLQPDAVLWQHQFDSPIVSIWQADYSTESRTYDSLKQVDLFSGSQWIWGSESSLSPSIYLGMHEKQLYIQESQTLHEMLDTSPKKVVHTPKFPWQPYPAISNAVAIKNVEEQEVGQKVSGSTDESQTTALSVLYASSYVNGNGYYLYTDNDLHLKDNKQCNNSTTPDIATEGIEELSLTDYLNEGDDTPVRVIIVSLWYWWKEVVIISITTAALLNFMLTQRLLNATTPTRDAILPPLIVERHIETKINDTKLQTDISNGSDFKSRYLTDFEPIDCLGKGGYGVVFEAKNKIDDCNYAIKRIALQNSRDSRERVMREVKALAKLDHHNIVRYFNAWLECPPMGWQEEHDQYWVDKQKFPPSEFSTGLSPGASKPSDSVCIDVPQSNPSSIDSAFEAYKLDDHNDDSDSFIVFEKSNSDENKETASIIDLTEGKHPIGTSHLSNDIKVSVPCNTYGSYSKSSLCSNEAIRMNIENEIDKSDKKRSLSLSLDNKTKSVKRKPMKMFLYIQMQLCQRLSLREWLKQQVEPRNAQHTLKIFRQIVDAVEYVHLQGLIHRDLKPSNIFFAFDDKVKIGDFGLVTAMTVGCDEVPDERPEINKFKNTVHTARVGTHLYMSPEQMTGQAYDYKVDIYSLGIILYELLVPFKTEMERTIALRDLRKSIFPSDFSLKYTAEYNLLKMMLDENPKKRPTTLGIKARPPLANVQTAGSLDVDQERWHFDLPQKSRHSSFTSSSSGESWESIS